MIADKNSLRPKLLVVQLIDYKISFLDWKEKALFFDTFVYIIL